MYLNPPVLNMPNVVGLPAGCNMQKHAVVCVGSTNRMTQENI
jgi:hypothetical protein